VIGVEAISISKLNRRFSFGVETQFTIERELDCAIADKANLLMLTEY
jgi:hypothetical protein